MTKRIFYFNITYRCDNNCIFCYSHNTKHNYSEPYREIPLTAFKEYLNRNLVTHDDSVIINGGEPMLYSEINEMLEFLKKINCETVIFTNGRHLNKVNNTTLYKKLRFVIPIHGFEHLHDKITQVTGSYAETISSMKKLYEFSNDSLLDLKIILNYGMIESNESFMKTLDAFEEIPFNNAVHITKMAATKVSELNNCTSLNNEEASRYTLFLLEHFSKKNCAIKVFDTCVKDIKWLNQTKVEQYGRRIAVKGKDFAHEEDIALASNTCPYSTNCANKDYCLSSVFNYKVLEFSGGRVYENLE